MRRAQDERVPVSFEDYCARRAAWSEQRCYPLPDGGVAVIWKNITEQKRAEERLHYLSQASAILASSLDYTTTVTAARAAARSQARGLVRRAAPR